MKALRSLHLNPWREISILMIILMEVCWVTPWFRSLTAATYAIDPVRVFIILLCMVIFAHLLVRGMNYLQLKKNVRQGLMVLFILLAIFVGIKTMLYAFQPISLSGLVDRPFNSFADLSSLIPAEFIVIVVVVVAFWRGLTIAQSHIGPSAVMDHFWLGIAMYVIFIFVNTLVTGESSQEFFFVFLFASLVAMFTARMATIGMLRGGTENRFNRYWLLGMLLAASLVVALAAFVGGLFGSQFNWIGSLLLAIFGGIVVLLWLIIGPVVSLVITAIGDVLNAQGFRSVADTFQSLSEILQGFGRNITDLMGNSALVRFFTHWAPVIRTVVFVLIIVVLIGGVIAFMAIRLWQDRARRQLAGEQKTALQSDNLFERLLDMLRAGVSGAIASLAQLVDGNQRRRMRAAARIRQVYADLMDLSASLDHPRAEAETPLEFLPELDEIFPGLQPEVAVITDAYNCIRYGQLPETQHDVEQVEQAWKKLASAGHDLSTELKHARKK